MTARFFLLAGLCFSMTARAAEILEPVMLPSAGQPPDLLLVARPQKLSLPGSPDGYAYEVCQRPADGAARRCPAPGQDLHACPKATDPVVSPYGGVRIQLSQGQTLKIRLVDCLPPAVNAKRAGDDPILLANATNLHTHGLIVEPRRADDAKDSFGDYIFVLDLPPNVDPPTGGGGHHKLAQSFDYRKIVTDYRIHVPANHPDGLFWFHPHVHGLALPQVSGGLEGLITVGNVHAYACDAGNACAPGQLQAHVRHIMLQDIQVDADHAVRFQENPAMCAKPDADGNVGGCDGIGAVKGTTTDANDGRWMFPLNGAIFPDITMHPAGEIWRIANTSASASYNLGVFAGGDKNKPVTFQVVALDGVSLTSASAGQMGERISLVDCPKGAPANTVCANGMRLMPSARAEIYVAGGAAAGDAVLRTLHRQTGIADQGPQAGDDWPSIDLAKVHFPAAAAKTPAALSIRSESAHLVAQGGALNGVVTTEVANVAQPVPLAQLMAPPSGAPAAPYKARAARLAAPAGLDCHDAAAGSVREVVFGLPTAGSGDFGLGYRGILAEGASTAKPASAPKDGDAKNGAIVPFDHAALPTVCVTLAPKNQQVEESWMLVNLAVEDHNFHVHQTRFQLVSTTVDGQTVKADTASPVFLDNVPLPHATGSGCDGTYAPWVAGTCKPTFVKVLIPFHEVGNFVYHCHILEHEDGGMMAKIIVVPNRG